VLLLPDRVAHHGVVERALAAIGDGPVLHLRTEMPVGTVLVDLQTGQRTVETLGGAGTPAPRRRSHPVSRATRRKVTR
jgi:hypothetical protein